MHIESVSQNSLSNCLSIIHDTEHNNGELLLRIIPKKLSIIDMCLIKALSFWYVQANHIYYNNIIVMPRVLRLHMIHNELLFLLKS